MATEITKVDESWAQTKLLNFQDLGRRKGMKTNLYLVRTRRTGTRLGLVRWERRGHGYTFHPDPQFVGHAFNDQTVADIASFCGWISRVYRDTHPYLIPSSAFKKRRARRIQNLLKKPDGGGLDKRYAPVVK